MIREENPTRQVYMFPGLGAEYPGMLDAFRNHYPWADALISQWSEVSACDLRERDASNAKQQEMLRQLRIHVLNLLWWRVAQPDAAGHFACCGHSLGFYAALVAAGALTEESSLRWLLATFETAWPEFAGNKGKIGVITTTAAVDPYRLANRFSMEVMARNSSRQIVVYGEERNLHRLCSSLNGILLRSSDLGTRIPFHSITMWGVCERVARVAETARLTVEEPARAVWSHLTGEPMNLAAEIRATLLDQPRRTVLWDQLMHNLQARHRPEFVEVGPSRILSQLLHWNDSAANVRYMDHLRKAAIRPSGAVS